MTPELKDAAEKAAAEFQSDDDRPKTGPKNSFLQGAQWLYDYLCGMGGEFDENKNIKQAFIINAKTPAYIFNGNPSERYFSENNAMDMAIKLSRWQYDYLSPLLAAKDQRIKELEDEGTSPYCPTCGICGHDGCCKVERCRYPDIKSETVKELKETIKELEDEITNSNKFAQDQEDKIKELEAALKEHKDQGLLIYGRKIETLNSTIRELEEALFRLKELGK